jgi:hypothetical protein
MRFTIILLIICSLLGLTFEKTRQQCKETLYRCSNHCRKVDNPAVRLNCDDECKSSYSYCMRTATY